LWQSSSRFFRLSLLLELLLGLAMVSAWIVCRFVLEPVPMHSDKPDSHIRDNYRILQGAMRRISLLKEPAEGLDPLRDINESAISHPQQRFLKAIVRLEQARNLRQQEIPARMPALLRDIPGRDAYLWREKNHLILRWLDQCEEYAKMVERSRIHPPHTTALRIRVFKALARTEGAPAAARLLRELFPRVSLGRLLEGLPGDLQRELKANIGVIDWDARFRYLSTRGQWSTIMRESRNCPHDAINQYYQAAFNYRRRRFTQCRHHLERVRDPQFNARKQALLIKLDLRSGQTEGIWERVRTLEEDEPRTHVDLLEDIAGLFLVENQLDQASQAYTQLIHATGLKDTRHWKALWINAWIHLKQDRLRQARRLFMRAAHSPEPGYQVAAAFWYRRLGGGFRIPLNHAPFSYYFVRAGKNHINGLHNGLEAFAERLNSPLSPDTVHRLERGLALLELGLLQKGREYLEWAGRSTGVNTADAVVLTLTLATLEVHRHRHYHAFLAYRSGIQDYHAVILPRFLRSILTPLEFSGIIARYSRERRLDPFLVSGLIREESMFRPDSRSQSNAYGLMQMLPETYAHISGKRLTPRLRWELVQPEVNIRWGTLYLRQLLDKYNDRAYLALAAYNAGDHRVDRWLHQFGSVAEEEFIEMIPFTETRNYVKNILRNRFYYAYYHPEAFD